MSNINDVQKWFDDEFNIKFWPNPMSSIITVGDIIFDGDIVNSWQIIRRGSEGTNVKFLQAILICIGYPCSLDGVFASDSVDALKQYQIENGFIVNGMAGKAVIKHMLCEHIQV